MVAVVDLQIATEETHFPAKEKIESWVNQVLTEQTLQNKELTVRIVDKEEIQELNLQYRGKDKPTNVLSFPFEMPDMPFMESIEEAVSHDLIGDLVICTQVVEQEAKQQNKDPFDHWAHMIVHGTLHLLGFDHIEDDEADEMESLEKHILSKLGIDDPYQDH